MERILQDSLVDFNRKDIELIEGLLEFGFSFGAATQIAHILMRLNLILEKMYSQVRNAAL